MFNKSVVVISVVVILMLVVGVGVMYAQGGQGQGGHGNTGGQGQGGHGGNGGAHGQGNSNENCDGTMQGMNSDISASDAIANEWRMLANMPLANDVPPDAELVEFMVAGIMDEYHAYQTYEQIMADFGEVRPFVNIQRAEAQHIEAWITVFERYGIDVPAEPTDYVAPTFETIEEACAAGAAAEIANFELYDEMYEAFSEYPDIQQVVISLSDASEFNHLPAFERCAQ